MYQTTSKKTPWIFCKDIINHPQKAMAWVWGYISCKHSMMYTLFVYTLLLILVLLYYVNHRESEPNHDETFKAKVQQSFIKFVEENMPKRDQNKETRAVYSMRTMSSNGSLLEDEHAKILKQRAGDIQREYIGFKNKKPFNFHCDKCAVVASSGQLLHSNSGQEIDNATCVIRMNNAPTIHYEKDVGARTDIRLVCFRSIDFMNKDTLMIGKARFDKMVIWGMENPKHKKIKETFTSKFIRKYPGVDYYSLSNSGEKKATRLYEEYLGMDRLKSNSWLSTGWFTMLFAVNMCDSITVYGLPDGNQCSAGSKKSILYHYYEKRYDECWMYNQHETRMKTGHRYLTEKAVFKQWAQMFNISFKAPAWNLTNVNASEPIKSPFISKMEKIGKKRTKR
ncbi:alpha-N-acetyl-neuraminyl-2,3-beta-galactosyl-1,3-N-acetyl-galactosaminide alpha-2,6-sialyltransferase-like [Amphiura filiformis]|uniref:alpha-N-acetyl-neuraminyl-2,3-beta-galactosyl-1, 3-N-acetyl-galactosaminide alpha-2,6-sialyltransferase-like n=1 Tax=Amphiura filiformis TaxID=82378 RepID=UPI003B20FC5A